MTPSSTPLLETSLDGLTLHRRGKVRDVYEIGDQLLIVTTDRISAFDYVLGSGIPDKGKVLTQLSGFWFERMGDLVPHHLMSIDPERVPGRGPRARRRAARPDDAGAADRAGPDRVRGARLPVRIGLEGIPEDRAASAASRCPAGLKRIGPPARADLHARDQGRERPRREHQRRGGGRADRPTAGPAAEGADARDLPPRRRARRHQGHHHRRHQVRVRPGRRRRSGDGCGPDRRSADARTRRASGRKRSTSRARASRASTSSSCATTSKQIKWNKQPPVPSLPDDVVRRTRDKYVEAFTLISGRELK